MQKLKNCIYLIVLFNSCSISFTTFAQSHNNQTAHQDNRAPRPDAPGSQDGSPVGAVLGCNTDQIIALLKQLNAVVVNCCAALQIDFNGTFTVLASQLACSSHSLKAPTIINTPGTYCLANDVVGTFTINANDVTFDLNGHTIASSDVGILVNSGTNRIIKNGRIDAMAVGGIMASGCDTISIQNILCTNCGTEFGITQGALIFNNRNSNICIDSLTTNTCANGILLNGSTNQLIQGCSITNSTLNNCFAAGVNATNVQDLIITDGIILGESSTAIFASSITRLQMSNLTLGPSSGTGLVLFSCSDVTAQNIDANNVFATGYNILIANKLTMQNCSATDIIGIQDRTAGFALSQITNGYFDSCLVQNIITDSLSEGFVVANSSDIIFKNCATESIKASAENAFGFLLEGSSNIAIQNCIASDIESPLATAYGFQALDDCSYITFDHCIATSCSSQNGAGFSLQSIDSNLTECLATACTGTAGYLIQTGTTSLQYCQANYNTGDGFLYQSGASLTGNCLAFNNQGVGFNIVGGIHIGYHNAAFSNVTNQYNGFGAINSVFDQVNPATLVPNGPFAGANLRL